MKFITAKRGHSGTEFQIPVCDRCFKQNNKTMKKHCPAGLDFEERESRDPCGLCGKTISVVLEANN